ncbi:hypothetical protein [Asticcacaulis sp. EMRT-3]|uniref:hypothetical protein n=1 Tax=Asticcacaulis sp. EMRT-3 TaxID=3040349 RepID=UPI0024AE9074|nr:hypothetical protein [Asticcacaulis sp. EMRT-3]MDI7773931.1 hypothetical protein [Asticcacaulis sp. EMRT-3]
MTGNLFLRTGVLFLTLGMILGIMMGMREDFTYMPVHAHINLVGGVLMLLAGLFYNSRPGLSPRLVTTHYVINLAGAILLPLGIYGSITRAAWFGPVVGIGSILILISMLLFVFLVFKGTAKAA